MTKLRFTWLISIKLYNIAVTYRVTSVEIVRLLFPIRERKMFLWQKKTQTPALTQVCSRYAIMAYEVLTGEMATGMRDVRYSFQSKSEVGVKSVRVEVKFIKWRGICCKVHLNLSSDGRSGWIITSMCAWEGGDEDCGKLYIIMHSSDGKRLLLIKAHARETGFIGSSAYDRRKKQSMTPDFQKRFQDQIMVS